MTWRDQPWWLVARREVTTKVRDRGFVLSTGVLLLLMIGSLVGTFVVGGLQDRWSVAVVDELGLRTVLRADSLDTDASSDAGSQPLNPLAPELHLRLSAVQAAGVADARALVRRGEVDAALVPSAHGYRLLGNASLPSDLESALGSAYTAERIERNAAAGGVSREELMSSTTLGHRLLDPGPLPAGLAHFLSLAFAVLFYVTALSLGLMIAQSVVQEKESRVVEILAATVPIRSVLWGKLVGNTILALTQILVLAVVGIAGLYATGRGNVVNVVVTAGGWFGVFFLLGFVALAGVWAVAGALAARQEDLQSTTLPGQLLVGIPFFAIIFGGQTTMNAASFIPIASATAMPARLVTGHVAWWEPVVSTLLVLVAAVLLVRLAAGVYERSLLRTHRRTRLSEVLPGRTSGEQVGQAG